MSIPFPSLESVELKERMAYVKALSKTGPDAGKMLCALSRRPLS